MTEDNPLNIKTITEIQKNGFMSVYVDSLKKAYTHDWIFGTKIEKLIILGAVVYSSFKLGFFLYGLI